MNDKNNTITNLQTIVSKFCEDRNWRQYHNPKDLAIMITTEASELLNIFRYKNEKDIEKIKWKRVMELTYYFDKGFKVYKIEGRLHGKVLLYHINLKNHIKVSHPEVSLKKIKEILGDPDCVYKYSRNSKKNYYEKNYKDANYRVVINKKKKNSAYQVITAYKIGNVGSFTVKHTHCIYDKEYSIFHKKNKQEMEDDKYYYEAFGVLE